jgi:hypothetical protein
MSEPQPEENKFESEIHDCVKRSPSLREKITVSLVEPSARLILYYATLTATRNHGTHAHK